ncbi:phosphate ABC transporter permease PstA [Methylomonas sp. MED-D]|uniref:Phosphate transport system permease protein PstA n=1 Tax=Methylomonas koyamae TaxID=702114 RepID=A0A177P389_9GAMM|nr:MULTISPECIES: phosphate ABC transporter permease PstA [Methylomonas]NJA05833.1 phosphate ABC transporter permease PstA [Methylococcaceae bacterium WWC4]MDT4330455.1 phosphate ABC transporter permease PstA [Methylomonas sp. MV1]OAI24705.1 phosphate ABC transporter, permease protein PstA [Methylomonas koyamae]OHX34901.1 phosphate ABC transporter, permease protein PstA [Methylomonas sp. LWB]WGS86412.1 phosphate ABC transporter permease PstA [Methylomonas sp. UP202]
MMKEWFKSGTPWIWFTAGAVSINLVLVIGLLLLIAVRGLGHFWPADIVEYHYRDQQGLDSVIVGEQVATALLPTAQARAAGHEVLNNAEYLEQHLVKTGNRDILGSDFRWILQQYITGIAHPDDLACIERREWGNFYGRLVAVKEDGNVLAQGGSAWSVAQQKLNDALALHEQIDRLQNKDIGAINYNLERLRLRQRKLELEGTWSADTEREFAAQKQAYQVQYQQIQQQLAQLNREIKRVNLVVAEAGGREVNLPLHRVVKLTRPNAMSTFDKSIEYVARFIDFIKEEPREANTEGGIFPAIFGTVLMVLLMAVVVTPFGVIAAVYLREYAKQGFITRVIRIAVNNLAGVPSIVYGVFGLGFFVYIIGGNIDRLFYPEAAPAPVFGTPGLLWAALTLALMTLPVVIVATEEGLSRIPKSIREGSLALGATKAETLWRTVLPMASPAIMTGLILAVARAAGEVAPLMLVGVVKLAPTLPLDGNFPYLHLDRKFMHLGFHIYDVGFQSPNVEAARPLVYATSLLLVMVIVGLNMTAIAIRNNLREKYRALEN